MVTGHPAVVLPCIMMLKLHNVDEFAAWFSMFSLP